MACEFFPRNKISIITKEKVNVYLFVEMENCKDENQNCPVWAEYNHCVINPGYMLKSCMKSCRVCTSGKLKIQTMIYIAIKPLLFAKTFDYKRLRHLHDIRRSLKGSWRKVVKNMAKSLSCFTAVNFLIDKKALWLSSIRYLNSVLNI